MTAAFDAAWLAGLQRRADLPPLNPRETLATADGTPIGSLEPALGRALVDTRQPIAPATGGWRLAGETDDALAAIATWLHREGHGGRWRDELLAVTATAGKRAGIAVGAIERAAVRPLGIATLAVHLVGHDGEGRVWVQQRAHDKATDPGLWDTLVGGLVSAGESTLPSLERETWEEAGLRLAALERLDSFGAITVRRPVADGYMVERIEMFDARLPAGVVPANQDGEVAGFELLEPAALRERLQADRFTLEAALILRAWVERRRAG